ncbi:MAG: hypothetical protein QNJ90_07860 [Planctomycetota bacterium]|nr:hypothetical protein [Planctomycetota bacterium]
MHRFLLGLLLLALVAGCGEADGPTPAKKASPPMDPTAKPADWPSAEARRLKPDHHPTPFTAAQIRTGCPDGRVLTVRMEVGGNELLYRWRFDGGDAEGVTFSSQPLKPDGTARGEPGAQRALWTRLQEHASFPSSETKVTEETIEVPAGTFACMRYTVTVAAEGRTVVTDSWFAWALPGPPVKQVTLRNGEPASKMELVENEMPGGR